MSYDLTPLEYILKEKPRWRLTRYHFGASYRGPVDWYWAPMNYSAETIWLMKVYGHTNTGRRFKE